MRSSTGVALAAALSLVLVSVPASADFHPACTGQATAYANTELLVNEGNDPGQEFGYLGLVSCPDAEITIKHLEVAPAGAEEPLDEAPDRSCSADTHLCTTSDRVPAPEPGIYRVSMTFDVGGFEDVERLQRWWWTGTGQPVLVCAHAGAFPLQAGQCPG